MKHRFLYAAAALHPTANQPQQALAKLDLETGGAQLWSRGCHFYVGEPVFARSPGNLILWCRSHLLSYSAQYIFERRNLILTRQPVQQHNGPCDVLQAEQQRTMAGSLLCAIMHASAAASASSWMRATWRPGLLQRCLWATLCRTAFMGHGTQRLDEGFRAPRLICPVTVFHCKTFVCIISSYMQRR